MLLRKHLHLWPYDGPAPAASAQIEAEGHAVLRGVFDASEVAALRAAILEVYAQVPPDLRSGLSDIAAAEAFRYRMFDRSPHCQRVIADRRILDVLEPLIGQDCHVINCTAWRNAPGALTDPEACYWHIDGGPQIPRPPGTEWPTEIPYPIFVVATHLYLEDCTLDDGPTTVVPTSHRSGRTPPFERRFDPLLEHQGRAAITHEVRAGDLGCFVSDVWHRRTPPTARSKGRFFLQTNYGRRDIAQRLLPTAEANQVSPEARARAASERERCLIGLHPPAFYDG